MANVGSFSGIASGIQWRDMVDQIMRLEQARRLDPLSRQVTLSQRRLDAWSAFGNVTSKLAAAAKGLKDGSAFGAFTVSGGTAAGGRALVTATASPTATPGTYAVDVLDLARAEKLSGDVFASATSALGVAGEFAVNGKKVTIASTDSLNSVRDRINALNAGTNPSGVTATVLSTGADAHRLVLTADAPGASGIELVDDAAGVLRGLGLLDATTRTNTTADGGVRSNRFRGADAAVDPGTAAIATMLGVTLPPPATIKVGGRTISVDLSVDSLSSIAQKIQAAGGTAEVKTETVGATRYARLVTAGTVEADGADATALADSQRTLDVLGLHLGGRGAVAQVLTSESGYEDATGAAAAATTLLTDLRLGGQPVGLAAGDSITIAGTRGDGSAVSASLTIGASDTMQTLVDRLNAADAFGGGRTAVASLDAAGKIVLADATGGDSQLSLSLSGTTAAGAAVGLSRTLTSTTGRLREVTDGTDARVRVDGVLITRATNTITDAVAGLTLSLQAAEPGTSTDVVVSRDVDKIVTAAQEFAKAYNDVFGFVQAQRTSGSPLATNGSLRAVMSQLTGVLLTDVAGISGASYTRAALVGVSLSQTGTLEVDATKLRAAVESNLPDVKRLFGQGAVTGDGEVSYVGASDATTAGAYALTITAAATVGLADGAGFGGTYASTGPETMTIDDAWSGQSGSVTLENGDSLATIVAKLNAEFSAKGMRLSASDAGGQLRLTGLEHGSGAGFTVAGGAQLGIAGTFAGTDVAGTFTDASGTVHAATGVGRKLTGAAGTPAEGLSVTYAGSTARAAGTVEFTAGLAGAMLRVTESVTRSTTGTVAMQQETIKRSIDTDSRRVDDIEQRLDERRAALVKQFTAMEQALAKVQAQGNWLAAQLGGLQQG